MAGAGLGGGFLGGSSLSSFFRNPTADPASSLDPSSLPLSPSSFLSDSSLGPPSSSSSSRSSASLSASSSPPGEPRAVQAPKAEVLIGDTAKKKPWIIALLPSVFSDNPLFNAGFGLALLGAGASLARRSWAVLQSLARRRLFTSLEISVRDSSYPWVMQWLVHRGRMSHHLGVCTEYCKDSAGNVEALFNFVPSPGRHLLRYKQSFVVVERARSGEIIDLQTGTPWETLTLHTLALQRHVLREILEESRRAALDREKGKTVIYRSVASEWRKYGEPKTVRPFGSVVLADGVAEQVHADVSSFLSSAAWYLERGVPYRRGYLLHGPPGCGKTSFVMALAGRIKYNICVLNVGDPVMTDDRLQHLLATVPPRSILLLEDIDCAIPKAEIDACQGGIRQDGFASIGGGGGREREDLYRSNPYGVRGVTFSGLLNALDGVVATEERLSFMTTNHPERLPESLIRPGRVDIKIRIGYATPPQIHRQFLRFFPGKVEEARTFVETLQGIQLSMAEVQGFFLFCKEDVEQALSMARTWKKADEEARKQVAREKCPGEFSKDRTSKRKEDEEEDHGERQKEKKGEGEGGGECGERKEDGRLLAG